jgi:hypothetical protein
LKTAKLLLEISPFFVLIPLVVLLFRYQHLTPPLKWIGGYILLCTASGFVSYILWRTSTNNLWVFPIQGMIELPLLYLALYKEINNTETKLPVFLLAILFVLLSIINSTFYRPYFSYNPYLQAMGSLLIIGYCIYYFVNLLREMKVKKLSAIPMFWIISSILFYYASSLFLYSMRDAIVDKSSSFNLWIWVSHALFTAIHYILISIGIWRSKTT